MSSPRSLLRRKSQFVAQWRSRQGWVTFGITVGGVPYMVACEHAALHGNLETRVVPLKIAGAVPLRGPTGTCGSTQP